MRAHTPDSTSLHSRPLHGPGEETDPPCQRVAIFCRQVPNSIVAPPPTVTVTVTDTGNRDDGLTPALDAPVAELA